MEKKKFQITAGGKVCVYPQGITFGEIARDFKPAGPGDIILVKCDGCLQELSRGPERDCSLEFVTTGEAVGHNAYVRTSIFVFLKAASEVLGPERGGAILHHTLGNGLYSTFPDRLSEEELTAVKKRMEEIVAADYPITKRRLRTDDAIALFHDLHMYDKEKLFGYRKSSTVNVYTMDGFQDYYYGYMAPSSGFVRLFDLKLYKDGVLLILPRMENPCGLEPFVPMEKLFRVQQDSQAWGEKMHLSTVAELNEQITSEGISNIVLVQEAQHEARIAEIAEEIANRKDVRFVMIAGPSSSGKTSTSHRLSIQLQARGRRPYPVAVDNYFVDRTQTPRDENGQKNFECLEALDVKQFNEDMSRLLKGETVSMPSYNFVSGEREYLGDELTLGEDDILVVEGIHGLNEKLSYSLPRESKYRIYVSAMTQLNIDEHNRIPTTDGRLLRRMVRDARTRGYPAKDTIAMWPSVRRGEEQYIFPFQEEADVMFNSSLVYELACLKVYAEPLLFGIGRDRPEYQEAKRLLKFLDFFVPIPVDDVPKNSILREFVGGSCFRV